MKKIIFSAIILFFAFQASAFEKENLSTAGYAGQTLAVGNVDTNSENMKKVAWLPPVSSVDDESQLREEKRDEFFLGVSIYSLIILVYSFYWYKSNKTLD